MSDVPICPFCRQPMLLRGAVSTEKGAEVVCPNCNAIVLVNGPPELFSGPPPGWDEAPPLARGGRHKAKPEPKKKRRR